MKPRPSAGVTLVETAWTLGLVGMLATLGASRLDLSRTRLLRVEQELCASLHQAFVQARAQGSDVRVSLGGGGPETSSHIPVSIPQGVRWGRPPGVPLPPGMTEAPVASATGSSHVTITITPRRTATAGAWFLHDGTRALCLRLSGLGRLTVLRWRPEEHQWARVSGA